MVLSPQQQKLRHAPMLPRRLQDPVITEIEQRLATWTMLNISHQEDMQAGPLAYLRRHTEGALHQGISRSVLQRVT